MIDRLKREQGSRDARLLPVALGVWIASLGAHGAFLWLLGTPQAWGVVLAAVLTLIPPLAWSLVRRHRWSGLAAVCLAGMLASACATVCADTLAWYDAAAVQARASSRTTQITADVRSPPQASQQRQYDCQVDVSLLQIADPRTGTAQPSSAEVRMFTSDAICSRLSRGGRYQVTGLLSEATFGSVSLWLTDGRDVVTIRAPSWMHHAITTMQQALFTQVAKLSDQAQVLVPGLTLGVLGQDVVMSNTDTLTVNSSYASMLETAFKRSGIMHLMAVSGGHFVLIAGLVQRLCRARLLHRWLTAAFMGTSQIALAALMYPGDSVMRAVIMGLISSCAYGLGRPSQSLSALCWTAIGVILINPQMSMSFGFALSCAAVLGIILVAPALTVILNTLMPQALAEATAMTMAAQAFTLPIQVLMTPEVPLLSVLANLIVTPVVAVATLAGIAALLTAWVMPWLALMLLRIASLGTLVMERTACRLGSGDHASLPWTNSIVGALAMLVAELALGGMLWLLYTWHHRTRRQERHLPGLRASSGWRTRIAVWWKESLAMLKQ